MKTTTIKTWLAACVFALAATAASNLLADQASSSSSEPVKRYEGTVVSVDPKENVLTVKGWSLWEKKFNLGESCTYALLEKTSGSAGDLRPGQKVAVNYRDAKGVLIADRVVQEAIRYEGMVKAIDAEQRTLILHRTGSDKRMQIADDCKIVLRNEKSGTYADLKVGSHVTVTCETPGDKTIVRQIAQTSVVFTGSLAAIDLDERAVKVKAAFASKKFIMADNCTIVINGKTDGKLSGLKPNDRLAVSYDEINGINVANRIATGEAASAEPVAISSASKP